MLTHVYILTFLIISQTACSTGTPNTNATFTIVNGQIFTPGLAIIDSPQPFTPMGGDTLHIAIDISYDGQLPLSLPSTSPTLFHNITIFLTSYTTKHNFTISNGSTPLTTGSSFIGPILSLEPSSTVKHVNFIWPACLVGDGSARGEYNISIHQSFRLNGSEFYTVFDLPISVTDEIPRNYSGGEKERVECSVLENGLLSVENVSRSVDTLMVRPFLGGRVSVSGSNPFGVPSGEEEGDGDLTALLAGAEGRVRWSTEMMVLVLVGVVVVVML